MKYALGYCFNLHHIFENISIKKIKTNYKVILKITSTSSKVSLCIKIFSTHVKMVLEDVINNDVTFLLPTKSRHSDIHMVKYSDENFINARRNGKFKEIDFLKTNFQAFHLGLFMYGKSRTRVKLIYVDKNLKEQLVNKINEGHSYA